MKIEIATDKMQIQQIPMVGVVVEGTAKVNEQDASYQVLFPPAAVMDRVIVIMPGRSFSCTKTANLENFSGDKIRERAVEAVREMIDFERKARIGLFGPVKITMAKGTLPD